MIFRHMTIYIYIYIDSCVVCTSLSTRMSIVYDPMTLQMITFRRFSTFLAQDCVVGAGRADYTESVMTSTGPNTTHTRACDGGRPGRFACWSTMFHTHTHTHTQSSSDSRGQQIIAMNGHDRPHTMTTRTRLTTGSETVTLSARPDQGQLHAYW